MEHTSQPIPNNEQLTDDVVSKSTIITVISVFMISVFVIALFLINKSEWEKKLIIAQVNQGYTPKVAEKIEKATPNESIISVDKELEKAAQEDSQNADNDVKAIDEETKLALETENNRLKAELQVFKAADSIRISNMSQMSSYKIYGLYRDKTLKQTDISVAKKFNIKSEKAIKNAEINGEKAFVVPVKGVHIAKNGDTAFSIARKYYKNNEKLSKLIEEFNGEIQAGMIVFLPFGEK
jgi:ABC-type Na+ efflux pump permease subunit